MVIVARWLVQLDFNSAGNEDLADGEIMQADLFHGDRRDRQRDRTAYARWLARGSVGRDNLISPKNHNEINDLHVGV